MKQTAKILTLAMTIGAGFGGTALANGTYVPPPAPVEAPPPPPVVTPEPKEETGPYVSLYGGVALPGDYKVEDATLKFDTGFIIDGTIGYDFGPARADLSIGYQQSGLDKVEFNGDEASPDDVDGSALTVLANGYYDIDAGSGILPYVTAGLGIANLDIEAHTDDGDVSTDETVFAWQVGAGVGVELGDGFTFDLGYRYLRPEGLKNDGSWESHNILAGVRYQF